ncbi:MAG: hypothetical protein IID17_14455, partial [Nitrospinae bacterium]|nr:hypothetical protein [Nitrospinota bacterium]
MRDSARVFEPVWVGDEPMQDGGMVDRCGIDAWRLWRPNQGGIVHWVQRTGGQDVDVDMQGLTIVRTPRSGANFFNLKDFARQVEEARELTAHAICAEMRSVLRSRAFKACGCARPPRLNVRNTGSAASGE